ncbi:hypothetical protein IWZ01DRAFT_548370 [Phyllosticta capitalensis]
MPNLTSFTGLLHPWHSPARLPIAAPTYFKYYIDDYFGESTTSLSEQQQLDASNRDFVYFFLRFFGWRNSVGGKPLETVHVNFDCRSADGLNVLERIGWRHDGAQSLGKEDCCFHSEQYSLFVESLSFAEDVDLGIVTEVDKSATEAIFLAGPGQDLLEMTKRAGALKLKLDSPDSVSRPHLDGFHPPVTHPDMNDLSLGLELSFPKWKSLRELELRNVEVFVGAMRDVLQSVIPGLRQLWLEDVVLNRREDEQGADWWTIFNLIRDLNVYGRLEDIVMSRLKVNAGYIQKTSGAGGALPVFERYIPDDDYDLDYFFQKLRINTDEDYCSYYRDRIVDFMCRRTDEAPQGWDDWDFLYAEVAADEINGHEKPSELLFHEALIHFLEEVPSAAIRCEVQEWDRDMIFVEHWVLQETNWDEIDWDDDE